VSSGRRINFHPSLKFLRRISPLALADELLFYWGPESESTDKKAAFLCARAHVPHKLFIEHQEKFRCRELLPVFWGNRTKEHETPKARSSGTGKFPFCARVGSKKCKRSQTHTNVYIWPGRSGAATTKGTPSCWVNALGAACLPAK